MSDNFYRVLEIAPSADPQTVKKAYFRLMRKYPPETHPEQFMKLREAYEVLSDPESRKQYDRVADHDAETTEVIRRATDALEKGRFADAQALLTALINQRPELDFARDLLGITYLRAKQPDPALAIFEELAVKHPTNGSYQLHRGQAHHVKKEYREAEAAYRKSFELGPDDTRPLVCLSDCFFDQKRWDDSLKVLDQAIHLDGQVDFKDFGLFVRKLEVDVERRDSSSLQRTLAQLLPVVPDDEPSRRYVADRLASLAAPLFAQARTDDANLLMREAAKLDPKRGTGRMPNSFEVDPEQLPEASKAWLKTMKDTPSGDKISNSAMGWPIFLLLLGGGGVLFCLSQGLGSRYPIHGEGLALMWLGLVLCGVLTAWSLRAVIEAARSPYGAYTIVHPLYMLQVRPTKVTAWPLANLHDARITHHHTNGVYSTSRIDLIFNGRTFTVSLYGKERSVEYANGVLARRRKMLELMYAGLLENSGDELRLIPAALIPEEGVQKPTAKARARSKRGYLGAGAVAAAATLVTAIAVPLDAKKADDRAWESAADSYYGAKVPRLQGYLARYPNGGHAEEARRRITQVYEDAEKKVKAHGDSELAPALLQLLAVLEQKQTADVAVKYVSKASFEKLDLEKLPEHLKGKVIDPRQAFNPQVNAARERKITEALDKAFAELLGQGVVKVGGGSEYDYDSDYRGRSKPGKDEPAPVTLDVRYEVGLTGTLYESVKDDSASAWPQASADKKFLGIVFWWVFDMKFEGEEKARYSFEFESQPAKDIRWTSYGYDRYGSGGYDSPTLPYDKMAESAFEDFTHQIGVRFGTEQETPRGSPEVAEEPRPKAKANAMAPKRRSSP
ncbi:MAG: DnaJ domain-containing protein [Archangiaceae bacterium]|nr:DnaJ domain-containing protein [Archangiaceae bacterium]